MKILITENQLESITLKYLLGVLNNMDFKMDNKDFSFFPKGTINAENGIEADWMPRKGYSILVGHTLWRTIRDAFGLDDNQTKMVFTKAFNEKGINKIKEVNSIDFSNFAI
jgi:hypothetical protein